jgi:hypothetical protein
MSGSSSSLFYAEWRRGLKDLQNAVLNPWNGVTQTHEEAGSIGNPTQQLVTADIKGDQGYQEMAARYAERAAPEKPKEQER